MTDVDLTRLPRGRELSPELALVDPELAAAARLLPPEPGHVVRPRRPARPRAQPPARPRPRATTRPAAARSRPRRRRVSVATVLAAGALAAMSGALGLVPASGSRIARPAAASDLAAAHAHALRDARAARTYAWPAVRGAQAYDLRIARGDEVVFESTTRRSSLELPESLELAPGRYTWTVTPRLAGDAAGTAPRPVVEATFVAPAP